jgi:hypothetical protein
LKRDLLVNEKFKKMLYILFFEKIQNYFRWKGKTISVVGKTISTKDIRLLLLMASHLNHFFSET